MCDDLRWSVRRKLSIFGDDLWWSDPNNRQFPSFSRSQNTALCTKRRVVGSRPPAARSAISKRPPSNERDRPCLPHLRATGQSALPHGVCNQWYQWWENIGWYTYTHTYARTHTHTHAHTHIYIYTYVYIYIYLYHFILNMKQIKKISYEWQNPERPWYEKTVRNCCPCEQLHGEKTGHNGKSAINSL